MCHVERCNAEFNNDWKIMHTACFKIYRTKYTFICRGLTQRQLTENHLDRLNKVGQPVRFSSSRGPTISGFWLTVEV